MTLAARCPSCRTAFKIPDAVLEKQQGLVRCARCSNVFNAFEHAFTPQQDIKTVQKPKVQNFSEKASERETLVQKTKDEEALLSSVKNIHSSISDVAKKHQDEVAISSNLQISSLQAQAQESALSAARRASKADFLDYQPGSATIERQKQLRQNPWERYLDLFAKKLKACLDFFSQRSLPQVYRSQGTPISLDATMRDWTIKNRQQKKLFTGLIIFFFLTFLSMLYWQRNALINHVPTSMVPVFMKTCEVLSCSIAPLRLANNPIVSFSDMQKDMSLTGNRYIMNIGLKNTQNFAVEVPFLEISLFDLNEQLIARRVFHPQEFLKLEDWQNVQTKGMTDNLELPIKIRFQIQQAVSSFKVVAFYP